MPGTNCRYSVERVQCREMSNNTIHQTRHIHIGKKENINRNHKIEIIKSKRVFRQRKPPPKLSSDTTSTQLGMWPGMAGQLCCEGVSTSLPLPACLSCHIIERYKATSSSARLLDGSKLINRIKYAAPSTSSKSDSSSIYH